MKKKVAVSACLLGEKCRYDGKENFNKSLVDQLNKHYEILPFCPEDYCFSTPRPTMDLVNKESHIVAISNETHENLSEPILEYAREFFKKHQEIELFIGKDRSPSCGVKSAKLYSPKKELISTNATGLMARVAKEQGIESWDSEEYEATHTF